MHHRVTDQISPRGRAWIRLTTAGSAALLAGLLTVPTMAATPAACNPTSPNGAAMWVTADCVDPDFNAGNFVIDSETQVATPVPHTRIAGHFNATATTGRYEVRFYLPPADRWKGRFFQSVYPVASANSDDGGNNIAFAAASGGYLVKTNGTTRGTNGYRVDAAAAKIARAYASRFYKTDQRIYGYVWGSSGGSEQVLGAMENSKGVWDGGLANVVVWEGSGLNANSIRAFAGLALKDKLAALADAVSPGGGDPRKLLTVDELKSFDEVQLMGNALRTFEWPMNAPNLPQLSVAVKQNDPTYVDDFWSKPGYAGANPPPYLKAAIVDTQATITEVNKNVAGAPISLAVDRVPVLGTVGDMGLETWVIGPDGKALPGSLNGKWTGTTLTLAASQPAALLGALQTGGRLRINNRWYLALNFYHRHTLPPLDRKIHVYDHFRAANGTPLYPQRTYRSSEESARETAGGALPSGRLTGKMMVSMSVLDERAHSWQGSWYGAMVKAAMGQKGYDDNLRIYLNDNAGHGGGGRGPDASRLASNSSALYQNLRDLSAWVEKGVPAPASTVHRIVASQAIIPASAAARKGIQPVVDLTVGGTDRIEVAAGQPVTFRGHIQAPPGTGKVVGYDWYLGGQPVAFEAQIPVAQPKAAVDVEREIPFATPGTYFVTLRGYAQRDGDAGDSATTLQNLDRVRVVVK